MRRVVVLGANGEIGTDLCHEFDSLSGAEVLDLSHEELDLCDYQAVAKTLASTKPDTVINLAAFRNLEACEEDINSAFAVNSHAVRNLAQICNQAQIRLVHFSTDYVFGGDQNTPYREDSPLNPLNVYGVSKASGEYFIRHICREHLIIRTSGIFGTKGTNFVETMLRLGEKNGHVSVVTDQVLSPTSTRDLIPAIKELIDLRAQGVYHITNSGSCSWYEFAEAIFDLADPAVEVRPTTTQSFAPSIPRPKYSVLDNYRLGGLGIAPLRPWRQALRSYLEASGRLSTDSDNQRDTQCSTS